MLYLEIKSKYEKIKEIYVPSKWLFERGKMYPEKIVLEIDNGTVIYTNVKKITVKKGSDFGEIEQKNIKKYIEDNAEKNHFPPFLKQDKVYKIEVE